MIVRMAPTYFLEAWLRMQMQIEKNYQGDFIPDGRSFYDFDSLVTTPGCRHKLDSLWKSFLVMGVITLLLPITTAKLVQPAYASGVYPMGNSSLSSFASPSDFHFAGFSDFQNTQPQYNRFLYLIVSPVPSQRVGPTLLKRLRETGTPMWRHGQNCE